jgi:sec-independent protein translocase protein TatC
MLMLAIPMLILFVISEIIARTFDRIRGRGAHAPNRTDQWADEEASTL